MQMDGAAVDSRGAIALQSEGKQFATNKKKQKAGSRAKHRLRSIDRDVRAMQDLQSHNNNSNSNQDLAAHALAHWKWVPNERCGSWYVANNSNSTVKTKRSCYFKSTDGHRNFWDFSLKRLNLALLEQTIVQDGGCIVVDSSVRKLLPDSCSKTIPIWAAVLNQFVNNANNNANASWDTNLYTPRGVVSREEHDQIQGLLPERVQTLVQSGAIVNPKRLVENLTKPLRVVWMNHEGKLYASNGDDNEKRLEDLLEEYFIVVCWNPSRYIRKPQEIANDKLSNEVIALKKHQTEWISENNTENNTIEAGYYYTPGAADDHESWAKHLTPALFWKNREGLVDPTLDEDQIDTLIDVLVEQEQRAEEEREGQGRIESCAHNHNREAAVYSYSDKIGELDLWIGSRRASRPPECWSGFDAILNVTNQEYEGIMEESDVIRNESILPCTENNRERFYLQLPVQEGKRDRTQLEKWMPVGLAFLMHHLQENRRVLVHCAQGKDRSVAVALVFVTMVCPLQFPLRLKPEFTSRSWDLSTLCGNFERSDSGSPDNDSKNGAKGTHDNKEENEAHPTAENKSYLSSGLPERVVKTLLDADGREVFLLWIHKQLHNDSNITSSNVLKCLADKEGVRIALHLIKQDREVAEPTRSTMQKINRFLMSSSIYR